MADADVVVIGGGPAGLAAAIVCATHGLPTRLVERQTFPIDKPCGEGLLPNGVAALAHLGVDTNALASCSRSIRGIRYCTSQGRTVEASFKGQPGLGIQRTDLSTALLAHTRTLPSLELVTGRAAVTLEETTKRPLVHVDGATWRPTLVIGADGLYSRTRTSLGMAVERRGHRWGCRQHFSGNPWTDRVEVYFDHGFEVYVTPVACAVNVAVLWDARLVRPPVSRSPVTSLVARVPALARRLDGRTPLDRARAAGPFDVRVRRPWRAGVLLLGDAAGYVDALTGEGVGLALEQAVRLSHAVIPALCHARSDADDADAVMDAETLGAFVQESRARARANRQLTRLLLGLARYPSLVEWSVAALQRNDTLFAHLLEVNMGRRELWQIPLSTRTIGN
jgi:2-polyprenyl-6-methoxyphenol hydroxylase-like FAD-dependent oxidoreductase